VNLKDFMLSEINQTQKDNSPMIPHMRETVKFIKKAKTKWWLSETKGRREWRISRYRVSVLQDVKSSEDG
jgi:hypothetical protein